MSTAPLPVRRVYLVVWWLDRVGGMEQHVTELALALARRGVEVALFSELPLPRSNRYARRLREAGVAVFAPPALFGVIDRIGQRELRGMRTTLRALQYLAHSLGRRPQLNLRSRATRGDEEEGAARLRDYNVLTRRLLRVISRQAQLAPPDVVHVHGCRLGQHWMAHWSSARAYPTVYTEHATISDWGGPHDRDAAWVIDGAADVVTCVSRRSRDSLRAELPVHREIPVSRHIVSAPRPVEHRAAARVGSDAVRLLGVARLARHKGMDVLLDAVALLRNDGVNVTLQLAGDGSERAALAARAAALGVTPHVSFLGEVDPSRLGELWAATDVGVLPSRTEALPLSLLEALAHGTPVVASNVGGIPEVLRHEYNGLLVPPDDPAALAAALRRLVDDRALARRMAANARTSFDEGGWSEEKVTSDVLSIYAKARARRAANPRRSTLVGERPNGAERHGVRRVVLVTWGLSRFGDMEAMIAECGCALASADTAVTVMTAAPVGMTNRYATMMRRSGVRLVTPSRLSWWAWSLRSRLTRGGEHAGASASAHRLAVAVSNVCSAGADVVHVHGWCGGLGHVVDAAAAHDVPTVYTEHADARDWDVTARPTPSLPNATLLTAASASARGALLHLFEGRATPEVIRHAGQRRARPSPPATHEDRQRSFEVVAVVEDGGAIGRLVREFARLRERAHAARLTLAVSPLPRRQLSHGVELVDLRDSSRVATRIAAADVVLLSPNAEGFGGALAEAMGAAKPVVVWGDADATAIRHEANGLVASATEEGSVSTALERLADDPLLAHALGVAARRTFESTGLRSVAVAGELFSLYAAARDAVAGRRAVEAYAAR